MSEWERPIEALSSSGVKELRRLQAENAELRELLLHMYTCMGNVDADGNHECFSCEYESAECDFDRRMHELGLEVGV